MLDGVMQYYGAPFQRFGVKQLEICSVDTVCK
jgi:hypothetical protein